MIIDIVLALSIGVLVLYGLYALFDDLPPGPPGYI